MSDLLNHPAFQGAVAPFIVALIVASALGRTRFAWLAILPAYATMVALDTGFTLPPLTASRRSWLIALLAPLVGVAADSYRRSSRRVAPALAGAAALVSLWVFWTLIGNREGWRSAAVGAGIAIYFAALVAAVLRLRDDGLRCGAAGLGLGIAVGIAGIVSASIGALVAGAALAAACGAMLVVQIALARMTGDERFFLSYAQGWRDKTRDEAMVVQLKSDPHSPDKFRANGPLSNLDAFYKTFPAKEGDRMYRPSKERVTGTRPSAHMLSNSLCSQPFTGT